jgi:hypothetical protein
MSLEPVFEACASPCQKIQMVGSRGRRYRSPAKRTQVLVLVYGHVNENGHFSRQIFGNNFSI